MLTASAQVADDAVAVEWSGLQIVVRRVRLVRLKETRIFQGVLCSSPRQGGRGGRRGRRFPYFPTLAPGNGDSTVARLARAVRPDVDPNLAQPCGSTAQSAAQGAGISQPCLARPLLLT